MHIENDIKLDFKDVLLKPKRSDLSSRSEVDIIRTFKFRYSGYEWSGIPIISSNMVSVSNPITVDALIKHKIITCLHKYITTDDLKNLVDRHGDSLRDYLMISTGITEESLSFLNGAKSVLGDLLNFICVDVANGYSQKFFDFCKRLRDLYPKQTIIAGNVVTSELVESLILDAAVDVVKVGLGSGAGCLSRVLAAVGVPQLSAVVETADAAHGLGAHIISDGGCVVPGDVGKAICAGGDFVMLGSLLAGHIENGGRVIVGGDGQQYMEHFGMSSAKANNKYAGGMKNYRASEGRELLIPYKGSIDSTIQNILGGLRSTGTYIGARKLKEFSKRATFIRVNSQLNESLSKYEV